MDIQQMSELLGVIAERVHGDTSPIRNGTAPVKLEIGFTNQIVVNDGIVITDAPPAVMDAVMKWIKKTNDEDPDALPVSASPGFGGLLIR